MTIQEELKAAWGTVLSAEDMSIGDEFDAKNSLKYHFVYGYLAGKRAGLAQQQPQQPPEPDKGREELLQVSKELAVADLRRELLPNAAIQPFAQSVVATATALIAEVNRVHGIAKGVVNATD